MNTHRTLGLLAAILVTAGQALVFAVDTSAAAQSSEDSTGYTHAPETNNVADAQVAYGEARGLVGG